jgi:FAD/FMN-containing dehydrogenase
MSAQSNSEPELTVREVAPGLAARGIQVLLPEDNGYSMARTMWNAMIDRRPSAIARCQSAGQVADVVRACAQAGLPLTVRGGGHSVAGQSIADSAVLLDLSRIREVRVDASARLAYVGGGALWADVDAETARHGLAVTGGVVSHTGVGGLSLGGGIGWLMRRCGATADNLVAATMVTADGDIRTVSLAEDPELLWALRGGGGGFGVVTQFVFALHPMPEQVSAGLLLFPLSRLGELLASVASVSGDLAPAVGLAVGSVTAPDLAAATGGNGRVAAVAVCDSTPTGRGWQLPTAWTSSALVSAVGPRPYPQWQQVSDRGSAQGLRNYWKSGYVTSFDAPVGDAIVAFAQNATSPLSHVEMHVLGGQHALIPAGGAAYGHRDAQFLVNITATWSDEREDGAQRESVRAAHAQLTAAGASTPYVNYLAGDETPADQQAAFDDLTWERLAKAKLRLDPTGIFGSRYLPVK